MLPRIGVRRKCARTAKDRRADARRLENVPDRRSPSQIDSLGRQKGILLLVAVQAEIRQVGLGIAAQEVEDSVSSRVGPRRKRGPGNRRLRRARGGNPSKPASFSQSSQVGKLARFEQPRDDGRVQTIQTEDDDLLDDANLPVVSMTGITGAERAPIQIPNNAFFAQPSQALIPAWTGSEAGKRRTVAREMIPSEETSRSRQC